MSTFKQRFSLALMAAVVASCIVAPRSSSAQTSRLCFNVPGVTQCIQNRFLQYWQENGGLAVFGYPITPEYQEQTAEGSFTVQYFERNRFEFHPEKPRPYDVLLGRLGDDRLRQLSRNWRNEPQGQPRDGCSWWPQTSHAVCGPFKSHWEGHRLNDPALTPINRSLQLFGLPLTEPRIETNSSGDTVLTQWFERARFEYHPSRGILLGLLGNETRLNPAPAADLIDQASVDIDQFWSRTFGSLGAIYRSPAGIVEFDRAIPTACGLADPSDVGPHYCPPDSIIYLNRYDLAAELTYVGDMAIVTIIAHEWGHHIQQLLDYGPGDYPTIVLELQSDCFAGAYSKDADERGLLDQGDIEEALASLTNAGDPIDTPWDDPAAHGSPEQRRTSFMDGYRAGVDACFEGE